jgi:hypothetical protein
MEIKINKHLEAFLVKLRLIECPVLIQSGEKISNKILNNFQNQGYSISYFNSDTNKPLAEETMKNAIMKTFNNHIQEMDCIKE